MIRLARLTLAAAAALAVTAAQAQIQDRTFKFATQNPKGHPIVTGMEKFTEIVAAKSGGKIKINMFPGGVLGGDAPNVSALQGGTIEMVVLNSGILASQAKEFGVYDFPFMFANAKEADTVVDGSFGRMMHQKLEPKGIVGLAYWELGFRNITNSRRPIAKVDDIAGLKLRVIPNAINVDWVKALGANPIGGCIPATIQFANNDGDGEVVVRPGVRRGDPRRVRHRLRGRVRSGAGADQSAPGTARSRCLGHRRRHHPHHPARSGSHVAPVSEHRRPGDWRRYAGAVGYGLSHATAAAPAGRC